MESVLEIDPLPSITAGTAVELPFSKSILNRYLIMSYLTNGEIPEITGPDVADDVILMQQVLKKLADHKGVVSDVVEIHCANAGTVARFSAVLAAFTGINIMLTGDERLQQRPVAELGDLLVQAGAHLQWHRKVGFLPVTITSGGLSSHQFRVGIDRSSQHLSALLMMGPLSEQGISVTLDGVPVSWPYVEMTVNMMRGAGAVVKCDKRSIQVMAGGYPALKPLWVADWSAAAFFLQALALLPKGTELLLRNLHYTGLQGDEEAGRMFEMLGVHLRPVSNGMLAENTGILSDPIAADFTNYPDLFNAFVIAAALLKVNASFRCPEHLIFKESDRLNELCSALRNNGFRVVLEGNHLELINVEKRCSAPLVFHSAGDHRLAMSFAAAGVKYPVTLHNPGVVAKSFPSFYAHLQKLAVLRFR